MLIIAPSRVAFAGATIADVESIAVEHASDQIVVEYGHGAADPAFADVARRRTTVKVLSVLRRAGGGSLIDPTPGSMGTLEFATGPEQSATAAAAMVVSTSYQLAPLPKGAVARRVIEFILIAPEGGPVLTMVGGAA